MASFHFAVKGGNVGQGTRHADYICREGAYGHGELKEELVYKEHGNMPEWAKDNPREFWRAADQYTPPNKGLPGKVYTEFEFDLPNELTREQQIALAKEFIEAQLGDRHPYTFAIHTKVATIDGKKLNPHVHCMFNERRHDGVQRDPEQFFKKQAYKNSKHPERAGAPKVREWNDRGTPKKCRIEWAATQNKHLEKYGHEARVDHRSLKDQGIDRVPEKHLGPKVAAQVTREIREQTRDAKTPGERKRQMAEYLNSDIPERAKNAYDIRDYKRREAQLERIEEKMQAYRVERIPIREIGEMAAAEIYKTIDAIRAAERERDGLEKAWQQRQAEVLKEVQSELVLGADKIHGAEKTRLLKEGGELAELAANNRDELKAHIQNKPLMDFGGKWKTEHERLQVESLKIEARQTVNRENLGKVERALDEIKQRIASPDMRQLAEAQAQGRLADAGWDHKLSTDKLTLKLHNLDQRRHHLLKIRETAEKAKNPEVTVPVTQISGKARDIENVIRRGEPSVIEAMHRRQQIVREREAGQGRDIKTPAIVRAGAEIGQEIIYDALGIKPPAETKDERDQRLIAAETAMRAQIHYNEEAKTKIQEQNAQQEAERRQEQAPSAPQRDTRLEEMREGREVGGPTPQRDGRQDVAAADQRRQPGDMTVKELADQIARVEKFLADKNKQEPDPDKIKERQRMAAELYKVKIRAVDIKHKDAALVNIKGDKNSIPNLARQVPEIMAQMTKVREMQKSWDRVKGMTAREKLANLKALAPQEAHARAGINVRIRETEKDRGIER